MTKMVVTIDGPAGVGKSTVSKMVAQALGATFLDTGAMYRVLTLAAIRKGVDLQDTEKVLGVLEASDLEFVSAQNTTTVSIDGEDFTDAIRDPSVTSQVRYIAGAAQLRQRLVEMQRDFAAGHDRIVTEGRDQGTVVFPDATLKFFLTADVDERSRRRKLQHAENGKDIDISAIRKDIEKRDASDINREVGPLTAADDAIMIDTTDLDAQGVADEILNCIERKLNGSQGR